MMNELERVFMDKVRSDFEKVKYDQELTIVQKNKKYANMMSNLERHFNIPLLECDINDNIDKEVYDLYLGISNSREFVESQEYRDEDV